MADPVLDPLPTQPDQAFIGLVNGSNVQAPIAVRCFAQTGVVPTTGHPVAGQTVSVARIATDPSPPPVDSPLPPVGFTGSAGRAVAVGFGPAG
ncbi:MAG: hypothetical protein V7603_3524 [Micromonosporaceae bacterium]